METKHAKWVKNKDSPKLLQKIWTEGSKDWWRALHKSQLHITNHFRYHNTSSNISDIPITHHNHKSQLHHYQSFHISQSHTTNHFKYHNHTLSIISDIPIPNYTSQSQITITLTLHYYTLHFTMTLHFTITLHFYSLKKHWKNTLKNTWDAHLSAFQPQLTEFSAKIGILEAQYLRMRKQSFFSHWPVLERAQPGTTMILRWGCVQSSSESSNLFFLLFVRCWTHPLPLSHWLAASETSDRSCAKWTAQLMLLADWSEDRIFLFSFVLSHMSFEFILWLNETFDEYESNFK